MLIVPRKRICTQQPQGAAQVDWGNPITKNILSAFGYFGGTLYDAAQRKVLDPKTEYSVPLSSTPTPFGLGIKDPNNGLGYVVSNIEPGGSYKPVNAFTAFYVKDGSITVATPMLLCGDGNIPGSGQAAWAIYWKNVAGERVVGAYYAWTNVRVEFSGVSNGFHTAAFTMSSGNQPNLWLDGRLVATGITISSYYNGFLLRTSGFENPTFFASGVGVKILQGISSSLVPNGIQDDFFAKQITENPWQIFRAPDSRIFVPTGGASTATYTIYPTGSLVFNNNTPSIKTNILPTSGNITYSGTNSIIFSNGATTYTITPSGSINYINSNVLEKERVLYTSGNITYSGIVVTQHTKLLSVSGLITYIGSVNNIKIKIVNPTGKISYTGTNPIYVPGSGVVTTRLPLTGAGN